MSFESIFTEAGVMVMYAVGGFILSITPIPFLPMLFFQGLMKYKDDGLGYLILFIVFNGLFALLPMVFIALAYERSSTGGVIFAFAMYWSVIYGLCFDRNKDS
ncbi:hypothetical protein [Pseudomonas sp. XWY-1]|uniref:hypothetical protein n=1 Tax=Pseudomonas sp. XWY-1 TaxID=2069256 RepID=UPI001319C4CA|nr:hypothetical protein [Pseudomonas sp. XWY-1]